MGVSSGRGADRWPSWRGIKDVRLGWRKSLGGGFSLSGTLFSTRRRKSGSGSDSVVATGCIGCLGVGFVGILLMVAGQFLPDLQDGPEEGVGGGDASALACLSRSAVVCGQIVKLGKR